MKLLHLLYTDFKRAVFSKNFLYPCLIITILVISSAYGFIDRDVSILSLLKRGIRGSGTEIVITNVLALFPFSMSYASEQKENSSFFYIIRSGPEIYLISKLIISAISAFLVVLVGISLSVPFLMFFAPNLPFVNFQINGPQEFFEFLMADGHLIIGLLAFLIHYSLSGSVMAICAVWFSTYIPNAFATLAAPMAIYFSLLRIRILGNLPGVLNPVYWVNAPYDTGNIFSTIMLKLAITLIIGFVLGILALFHLKRRIVNE